MAGVLVLTAGMWCGCGRDAHLVGEKLRHATVKTATYYGMTLDQDATPEQVAFVAMRAIREDFLAKTPTDREAALDRQFDVCAADVIASRNHTAFSRDEFVHYVVSEWTPTVAHYVGGFEADSGKALARMVNREATKTAGNESPECELALEVADPGGDPAARVVMLVWLAKDNGYWRVVHFGFEPRRSLSVGDTPSPTPGSGRQ